jgi:ribosomal protein S18 acetylase RimI-like enzyme
MINRSDGGDGVSDSGQEEGYSRGLQARRTTKSGLWIILRPIKPGDAGGYKVFLESLSDQSVYFKFFRHIRATDDFVEKMMDVDHVRQEVILAFPDEETEEKILGMARYDLNPDESTAEVYFGVREDFQNRGIGRELLTHLVEVARKRGLKGFTAEVMVDNRRMLHLFRSLEGKEFNIRRRMEAGVFYLHMDFL